MTVINASAAVTLLSPLGEHCIGIPEVVASNAAQSLNFFQVSVLVVLRPHLHFITVITQLLLVDKINFTFSQ